MESLKPKIMPVLGCMARRIYTEKYLIGKLTLDPCLTCPERSVCYKTTIHY